MFGSKDLKRFFQKYLMNRHTFTHDYVYSLQVTQSLTPLFLYKSAPKTAVTFTERRPKRARMAREKSGRHRSRKRE